LLVVHQTIQFLASQHGQCERQLQRLFQSVLTLS
jgi:hypothetical protein